LEILVNVESAELLEHYVAIEVVINPLLMTSIEMSTLPRNWRTDPPPARIRAIGDRWVAQGGFAVLQVPSSVIPSESNFLLNPRHPDFQKLQLGRPTAFRFDLRLT